MLYKEENIITRTEKIRGGIKMSEIKIQFTYYHDPVTLDHLKQMIPVTEDNYDGAKDVWELPYKVFLRNTGDGRYYCMNKGETDFEYRCIIAEEYYKGEPYEGVILGFILV